MTQLVAPVAAIAIPIQLEALLVVVMLAPLLFFLMAALYLWRLVPRYVRPLLAVYPPLMSLALVYSGEHYAVDCIFGWVYAVAAFVGVNWAFAWRERRAMRLEPAFVD